MRNYLTSLAANWKTTSAGITSLLTGISLLISLIKTGVTDLQAYSIPTGMIVAGLGFLCARDSSQSAKTVSDLQAQLDAHQDIISTLAQQQKQPTPATEPTK